MLKLLVKPVLYRFTKRFHGKIIEFMTFCDVHFTLQSVVLFPVVNRSIHGLEAQQKPLFHVFLKFVHFHGY